MSPLLFRRPPAPPAPPRRTHAHRRRRRRSACLWAYIIGSACGIISNLDVSAINHYQTLDQLNYFVKENKSEFSGPLRDQMREFFHHTKAMRRTEDYHLHIISKMSPVLQREV